MQIKISSILLLVATFMFNIPTQAKDDVRKVEAFSKISLRISAKVTLVQGDTQSIRINAEPETLEEIITEVKDRTLNIRFPGSFMFRNWNPGEIEIFVTVPEIDGLTISGSGDIVSKNVDSRIINLVVSGSGMITIDKLAAEKVDALVSGSGNINIESGGVAENMRARVSGSGSINASGFEAKTVDAQTSGSGNVSVISNGQLNVHILGSGSVYYSGNPGIDSSITGSGKVEKR